MLTPNLMPGSVCIREDGTPTALTPAVSLETWMEFYWKVRAFNVTGSGSFTDDNFQTFTDTLNVPGDSIQGVTMRSFMCQLLLPGLLNVPPNPLVQSGVFGSYVGPPGNPSGNFSATLTPTLGFKSNGNYYISVAFAIDVVSTSLQKPAGQITFILESGSFVIPLSHNFEFGFASYNLVATPASFNIPD